MYEPKITLEEILEKEPEFARAYNRIRQHKEEHMQNYWHQICEVYFGQIGPFAYENMQPGHFRMLTTIINARIDLTEEREKYTEFEDICKYI